MTLVILISISIPSLSTVLARVQYASFTCSPLAFTDKCDHQSVFDAHLDTLLINAIINLLLMLIKMFFAYSGVISKDDILTLALFLNSHFFKLLLHFHTGSTGISNFFISCNDFTYSSNFCNPQIGYKSLFFCLYFKIFIVIWIT